MGINKPNVRFVVHYDLPKNLESYYQRDRTRRTDGCRVNAFAVQGRAMFAKQLHFIDEKSEKEARIARAQLQRCPLRRDARMPTRRVAGIFWRKVFAAVV